MPTDPLAEFWQRHPRRLPWLVGLALILLCWLAFFNGLGVLGFTDKTEALFVEVGHQMVLRQDWITPWWNGERFFDYPVWGYWMVALAFKWFGISEWAARLPVALAASAVVVASFALVLSWAPSEEPSSLRWGRGLLAASVLATSPGWVGWGRTSTTDMFLSSAITLALYGFLLAQRHPAQPLVARLGRVALALFCGVAVLAKGPVGLLLPGLVIVVFLTLTGQWRPWLKPAPLLAMLALFLGVAMPWYGAAAQVNGVAFLGGFLGFSNLQRFTSVLYNHPGPFWYYLPCLLLLLLPWSLFLPAAIAALRFWRLSTWRAAATNPGLELPLFLLLWLAVMVAFFSAAATKLPGYILPVVPAASLLVALAWRPFTGAESPAPGWLRRTGWLDAGLLALLAAAAALAPRWAATDPAHPELATALSRSGLPLLLAAVLAAAALALVVLLTRPGSEPWLWLPNLFGFLAILALVVPPLAPLLDRQRQLPLRELARQARRQALSGEPLWVVGAKRYSILFYGGETAVFLSGRGSLDDRLRDDPASLGIRAGTASVRMIGDVSDLEDLKLADQAVQRLNQRGQQQLWRVRREDLMP
ncbi:MAG: glycosyltransferase family 39 protein [Cyanobium sp.]